MIKIFDRTTSFPNKVNFIDEYNNLIGFSMEADCCADFGWYIEGTDLRGDSKNKGGKFVLQGYCFDIQSLQILKYQNSEDEGREVNIKLRGIDRSLGYFNPRYLPVLILHIFNKHNGYYSHGFNLKIDDERMEFSI